MSLDLETKLDLIVTELKRRILVAFPTVKIYEGSGGVWGIWNQTLPCIHIFELMSSRSIKVRGVYTVTQPIQFEYVTKLSDRVGMYSEGRAKKLALQKALELDERIVQNKGLDSEGKELAVNWYMAFDEIVEVTPNTIDCAIQYEVTFTERFFGYNP